MIALVFLLAGLSAFAGHIALSVTAVASVTFFLLIQATPLRANELAIFFDSPLGRLLFSLYLFPALGIAGAVVKSLRRK